MGVLKNDVGRPSNKTKKVRRILIILGISLILVLCCGVGYYLNLPKPEMCVGNECNLKDKEITQTDKVIDNKEQTDLIDNEKLEKCSVKVLNLTENSLENIKKKITDWRVSGYDYIDNGNKDSSSISTYDKVSSALYSLGYFDENVKENLAIENACYIDKKVIDDEIVNIYLDSNYNPEEFSGNDCLPFEFKYNKEKEQFILKNRGSYGCGDGGASIDKIYDIKENKFSTKVFYLYGNELGYLNKNDEFSNISNNIETVNDLIFNKYDSYANVYEWNFAKNKSGKYVFDSIKKVK